VMSQRTPESAVLSWSDQTGEHREESAISPIYV
jgi:hypothetical protein